MGWVFAFAFGSGLGFDVRGNMKKKKKKKNRRNFRKVGTEFQKLLTFIIPRSESHAFFFNLYVYIYFYTRFLFIVWNGMGWNQGFGVLEFSVMEMNGRYLYLLRQVKTIFVFKFHDSRFEIMLSKCTYKYIESNHITSPK